MGSQTFSAQYQQAPVPPGSALIQWHWFKTYDCLPKRGPNDRIVQSWDTASKTSPKNDYSVCTTWLIHGNDYYLLDVLRRRLEYPDLRRLILSHWQQHGSPTVLIEDTGPGMHLNQELQREGKLRPVPVRPEGEKVLRMEAQTGPIESGYVHVPAEAPWLGDFQIEMMQFPYGRHDDQVDSVSQFLNWAASRPKYSCPSPIIVRKTRELGDRFSYR
jgi:predicted phage terminase large subunit-like protein